MGVQGLWQLLQSTGHPVSLESLAGKVLGIDVSIWLHQASKGMRDRHGNAIPNAHLIVLFKRICKLLYYRIKPVFVFDGGIPILKKQTLMERRHQREDAVHDADLAAKKLVSKLLQKQAVNLALNSAPKETKASRSGSSSQSSNMEMDIFSLPPLPKQLSSQFNDPDDDRTWERRMERRDTIFSHFEDVEKINTESEDFAALPAEIKHEILTELKDIGRRKFWAKLDEMPSDSDEFSKFQLNRLMKQSRLSQHLSKVRKELSTKASGDIAIDIVGDEAKGLSVEASRIFSDDSSHYFLIKGLRQVQDAASKATSVEEFGEIEDQEHNSELNHLIPMKSKESFDVSDEEDLRMKDESAERLKTVKNLNENEFIVPAVYGSIDPDLHGSIDLSDQETVSDSDVTAADDDDDGDLGQNSSSAQLKRKIPEGLSEDETRAKLKRSGFKITPVDRETDTEINDTADEIKTISSVTSTSASQNSCSLAGIDILPSKISEDVDVRSGSDTSDDEGFIEVEPILTYEIRADVPETDEPDSEVNGLELLETNVDDIAVNEEMDGKNYEVLKVSQSEQNQAFGEITENDLLKMQESLEGEVQCLRQERGKQERLATSITDQMQIEAQELLGLFGVPYVVSPMEAEAQCAFLDLTDQTEGTVTDDSDVWLFGGCRVYRNMFNQNRNVELYMHIDIKSQLLLDRKDLIKLALLCGSDYTEGLQGVGPVSALEILAEFPGEGIEGLLKFRNWWHEAQNQITRPQETKVKSKLRGIKLTEGFPSPAVFDAYLSPTVDSSQEPFSWAMPDLDLLRHYGVTKLGWSRSQVDELLLPLMKSLNQPQAQQSLIRDFFVAESKEVRKPKSSRVRNVINRIRSQNNTDHSVETNHPIGSSKGKATAGLRTKNHKRKTIRSSSQSGGFVSSAKQTSAEINLSEESSDEDDAKTAKTRDNFELSDEILAAIDIDAEVLNANTRSTASKSSTIKGINSKTKSTKKLRTKRSELV